MKMIRTSNKISLYLCKGPSIYVLRQQGTGWVASAVFYADLTPKVAWVGQKMFNI